MKHLDALTLAALLLALAGATWAALADLPGCSTDTECGCTVDCLEPSTQEHRP